MKIVSIEALHCDGGWRPWTFVRVETDDGLVGWGECSDSRSPYGIAGAVRDLTQYCSFSEKCVMMSLRYCGVSHGANQGGAGRWRPAE